MQSYNKKIDHIYYDLKSKPLGQGAFGKVYKAYSEKSDLTFALKVIPTQFMNENDYGLFLREINVLSAIKGNHIVQLKDFKRSINNIYILTDYCDGGTLEQKIQYDYAFTEEEALSVLEQIVDAFITIENMQIKDSRGKSVSIMHRDIKPANILFHQGQVKVADFGFAKFVEEINKEKKQVNTLLGTPLYMPPQVLNGEAYSTKCDIWSTGCLFYHILFGKVPWTGISAPNLYKNIITSEVVFPKKVREETKDLIVNMLKIKEEERFSWKDVRDHPALKNYRRKRIFS